MLNKLYILYIVYIYIYCISYVIVHSVHSRTMIFLHVRMSTSRDDSFVGQGWHARIYRPWGWHGRTFDSTHINQQDIDLPKMLQPLPEVDPENLSRFILF